MTLETAKKRIIDPHRVINMTGLQNPFEKTEFITNVKLKGKLTEVKV